MGVASPPRTLLTCGQLPGPAQGSKMASIFFEVRVDSNVPIEIDETEEHPHALR